MRVTKMGYHHAHDENFVVNRPEGLGEFLLLIIKTKARFFYEGEWHHILPNTVMLYCDTTPQLYKADDCGYVDDWIHFTMSRKERESIFCRGIPFDTPIPLHETIGLSEIIAKMSYEYYSMNPHQKENLGLYMQLLVNRIADQILESNRQQEHSIYYERFTYIRSMIYNNPKEQWCVDDLAKKLHMSRSAVQHLYKQIFNTNVISDVITSRIEHAKHLLYMTDLSVAQIGQECGYHNEIHFFRQFKERTGTTPAKYRKGNTMSH